MTTTNNMDTNFNFRSKFKKLLNDENRSAIMSAFHQFCRLDPRTAQDILWRLTYSTDIAIAELYKLNLDVKIIPTENILTFRNELRFQYERNDPEFMDWIEECNIEEIRKAFYALKNRADAIVATVIYDHCDTVWDENEFNRTLFLLKSEQDNNYFGGIRSLDFNKEEAEYLKPFHIEIHNLLKALNDALPFYTEEEEANVEENEFNEEEEEQAKNERLSEISEEGTEQIECEYKILNPEEILAHKELFKAFTEKEDFNMLIPIGQLGFDLNEVMLKREEIFNFIKSAEDLIS